MQRLSLEYSKTCRYAKFYIARVSTLQKRRSKCRSNCAIAHLHTCTVLELSVQRQRRCMHRRQASRHVQEHRQQRQQRRHTVCSTALRAALRCVYSTALQNAHERRKQRAAQTELLHEPSLRDSRSRNGRVGAAWSAAASARAHGLHLREVCSHKIGVPQSV